MQRELPARGRADPRGRARAVAASPRATDPPRHRDAAGRTRAARRRTHRRARPTSSSTRWFSRGSRTRSPSEPAKPAFGSCGAEHHPVDAGEHDRARAHRARLERDDERAPVEPPRSGAACGLAQRRGSRRARSGRRAVPVALPAAAITTPPRRTTAPTGTSPRPDARPRLVERQAHRRHRHPGATLIHTSNGRFRAAVRRRCRSGGRSRARPSRRSRASAHRRRAPLPRRSASRTA